MLNLIRPKFNETYGIHNPTRLNLLTSLQLGLSYLSNHKFNYNFRHCINPLYSWSLSIENGVHL